jgi:hypothetical protein
MPVAMNIQGIARRFDAEFREKNVGHVPVEVLAGVNENLFERLMQTQRARESECLDELGPRADDGHYSSRTIAR